MTQKKSNIAIAAWLACLVAGVQMAALGLFLLGITPFVLAISTSCTQVNLCGLITGSVFSVLVSVLCCLSAVTLANEIEECDEEAEKFGGNAFFAQHCDELNGVVPLLWVTAGLWLCGVVANMLVGPPNSSGYDSTSSGIAVVEMADAKVVQAESA